MEKNEIERLIRDINSLEFEHEHINKKINQLKNEAIEIEKQIQLKKASLNQLKNGLKNERLTQGSNCYNKHYHHPSTKSLSSTGYNDARWLAKREEILKRDLYKCQMCHGTAQEVHHINYLDERRQPINNEYWRSPNENLVSLCHNCHEKFDGTKCEDTVFIPAKHPIKIEKMTDDNAHGVLVNPKWEEIVPYLRNIQIYGDGYRERLLLVVLCPYFTSLGKELLLKEPKQGLNELEKVQLLCRYTKDISPKIFINDLRRLSVEYPSTKQNVNYIINHLSPLLSQCKERPTEGVIVMASRNKRNGYYISIFDIEKKEIVKKWDFSDSDEYRNSTKKNHNRLAKLYAISYIQERCKGKNYADLPVFPNDPNGNPYLDIEHPQKYLDYFEGDSIYNLAKSKLESINFSKFYIYSLWDTNLWGDIPTKNLRHRRI